MALVTFARRSFANGKTFDVRRSVTNRTISIRHIYYFIYRVYDRSLLINIDGGY